MHRRQHLGGHGTAGIGLLEAYHLGHAVLRTQEGFQVIEQLMDPELAVVEQPDRASRQGRQTGGPVTGGHGLFERGIEHTNGHRVNPPSVHHSSMTCVTAWALEPSHGGMIAPKPPAGPPAATTNKSAGSRSARNSCCGPPLRSTIVRLPTVAHSRRNSRVCRNMKSWISCFCQPAAAIKSRNCFGMTMA